ncbi:MAG TPA: HAMP domain-containing sensor histidine kinase [Verrucomicrobiae bacterium]
MYLTRKQARVEWGFITLLAVFCAVLTWLQYRWTGEISRAEEERMRAGLETKMRAFCRAFDDTLSESCAMMVPDSGTISDLNRLAVHEALFEKWRSLRLRPLFRRMAVAVPRSNGTELYMLNQGTGKFAPANWPLEWQGMRQHMDYEGIGGGGPYNDPLGQLIEFPVFGRSALIYGGNPEFEWVIFELDANYLHTVWLPKLAENHFNIDGQQLNLVQVTTLKEPVTTIFSNATEPIEAGRPQAMLFNRQGRSLENEQASVLGFRWQLIVTPEPDAMDKLVLASRHKNFAVAVLLNTLILASGLMLVRQTRRSRQLAEQQIKFVAGVSHELRTPLTVIRGAAHNLKRGVVQDRSQIERYSALIIEHVEHLGEMVEQILTLSGAQRKSGGINRQPVAMADLLVEAVTASETETQAARCTVELDLSPDLPPVAGDPSSLRRVFQNLIANAAKHGGAGQWIGITARLDARSLPPMVEIQVKDRGPGIPEKERRFIFEPFYRGEMPQQNQVRGSGLGLSLVQEIVHSHEGQVRVHSVVGRGAIFQVRLPVYRSEKNK